MLYEVSFKSVNKRDDVQAWIYVPAAKPKGIVQLVHGFGEHSRRYLHMIMHFVEAGYIVADESTKTSIPGVYAVGDVRTKALRQIVTAVADGAVAAHYAEEYLAEIL